MKINCVQNEYIGCTRKPKYFIKSNATYGINGVFAICSIHFLYLFPSEKFITEIEYKLFILKS